MRSAALVIVAAFTLMGEGCASRQHSLGAADAARHQSGVVYRTVEGDELLADIYVPPGAALHPAVLVVHGGAWGYGKPWQMWRISQRLGDHGYTVVNIGYHLAPRYHYPTPLEDCRAGVRWMRAHAAELRVDPQRIAAWGYSAGGHLVALLALNPPDPDDARLGSSRVQAAVIGGAPTDLVHMPPTFLVRFFVERFLGSSLKENRALYDAASPLHQVSGDDPPTFVYHGASDGIVPVQQSRALDRALAKAAVVHHYEERDGGHLSMFLFDDEVIESAIRFLDRWL